MDYLETVNHPFFKAANRLVHDAEEYLLDMGLSREDARDWIRAWVGGAGDGSE